MNFQDYSIYKDEDHDTWSILCQRQQELHNGALSRVYLDGYKRLGLDRDRIIKMDEVSETLEAISGWTLVPVSGLIPTKEFFYMLINKKYPVTTVIRKPWELDFSEQPDIFHDICGHLPMLTNEKFTKFLSAYSTIALKYVNNDRAVEFLGRLYWFTYEMGLIEEDGECRAYGGAIITSKEELANVKSSNIPKYRFDVDKIFRTPYNSFRLQNEYFVIDGFDDLFNCLDSLEAKLIEHLLLPSYDQTLRNYPVNPLLGKGFNNVIGFLNDTQYKYPEAISFVAGQPDESFFDIEHNISKFDTYVDHMVRRTGRDRKEVINKLGQYGRTKGLINDIIAEYLRKDENIAISEDHILVTVGAQEAFSIIVSTVCDRENDVILVEDPSYIGLSSFARVFDYAISGVVTDEDGIDIAALKNRIIEVNRSGRKVKLVYVIPDYQNPSGSCMPIGNRLKLLELAQRYNFLIIEDSVYNSFTYAQKKNPTLKSLDRYNRVIYVGSFSKSLFPGLRIGMIAADQQIEDDRGETVALIDEMVKVKAQLTNNTSAISQAILGGVLLDLDCSLSQYSKPKFESYRRKRDQMLHSLNNYIRGNRWAEGISWNEPDGGFFIKMKLPFRISSDDVVECARDYGVLFCPMKYFYLQNKGEDEIRLTFSNLSHENIDRGVQQLADYLRDRVLRSSPLLLQETESNIG